MIWKLNFEGETNLEITKGAKVVKAYLHNLDRVTLVYYNVGSFTFRISELESRKRQVWNIETTSNHRFRFVADKIRIKVRFFSQGKGDKIVTYLSSQNKHLVWHLPKE